MRLSVISALALLAACGAFQQPPPVAEAPVESVESKGYEHLPKDPSAVPYKVARDPIALFMDASGLHATTTVHYSLEGCRITQKPFSNETTLFPCVSCGFDEPMRDATIALDAQLEWDENWRLRTRTRPRPIAFGRRCTGTFMNLDITDWKLAPIENEQLQQAAKALAANTPKLTSIRPGAAQIWSSLQTPAEIAPRTWLVMEPLDIALAPISGGGLRVSSALSLRTRTRVVVGDRPQTATKPLPPLHAARDAAAGVRVPFDVELSWDEASRLLTGGFGG